METLTKRSTKGSALTFGEMDGNWDKIAAGVAGVETLVGVSLNPDGSIKDQKVPYAATTNGTDTYAVAISGTFASLSDLAGRVILVLVDTPNTGVATLTVNGTLTDNILKQGGQALASGDIKAGVNAFMWDATTAAFLMVSPPGTNSKENYGATTNATNDYTITVASLNGSTFEVPAAYYAGYSVRFTASATNTGAARLKVAVTTPAVDLGFADVKKNGGSALTGGEFQIGQVYELVHDGTNFQLATSGTSSVVLQVVEVSLASAGSNAASIPVDTSIPQITEGTEILTLAITPKSAQSKLHVEAIIFLGNSGADNKTVAALFRDSTASAVAAGFCNIDGTATVYVVALRTVEDAVAATATTFRLRVGAATGTTFWNQSGTGNNLGGSMKTSLRITEVLA